MLVYSLFITFHGKRLLLAVYLSESYLHCCVTGVFAAAHDLRTEWVVVKGIKNYADSSQLANDEWGVFASVMAASVVSNILSNPIVFKEWPNYQEQTSKTLYTSQSHYALKIVTSERKCYQV